MFDEESLPRDDASDRAWAVHFGRKVIHGLIDGRLTPERAEFYARLAGSYGRRALVAHDEVVATGLNVIVGAFGGAR